ncbi:MAG: NAD(+) diphosphatase [Sporomusaceae bacterium]|nr:NAD(+) diphosphatase [Sporomusaceae bacterium]
MTSLKNTSKATACAAVSAYKPEQSWLLFHDEQLIVKGSDGNFTLPQTKDLIGLTGFDTPQSLTALDGQTYYTASANPQALPEDFHWKTLRQLAVNPAHPITQAAYHIYHITHWLKKNKFCSCCAAPLTPSPTELALVCPACKNIVYPRISPAIIVAVKKDNKILLAQGSRFKTPMFSTLAGFVEAGETIEDCVRREIREEVGIEVKNIRYVSSQPWPFPDSLMLGFTAEWASGEIQIDNEEILSANWFDADHLPLIPTPGSIARQLIDSFVAEQNGKINQSR